MGIPAVTLGNGYTGGIPALNLTYALGVQLAGTRQPADEAVRQRRTRRVHHREPDRRVARRRRGQRRDGGRPPRLRPRGPGHQRQRLRLQRPAGGRRADGRRGHGEQGPLRLVVRRGGEPGRVELLRRAAVRRRARRPRDVPQLRHGRLAELRPVPLRRRRVQLRAEGRRVRRHRGASSATRAARASPRRRRRSTAGRTTRPSSSTASPPADCSPAPRASRRPAQAAKWGDGGHRLRPVLPPGLRHHRQPQPRGAVDQLRRDRLRHLPVRDRRRFSPPARTERDRRAGRVTSCGAACGAARRRGAARSACPRCGCRRAGSPCPAGARPAARRARSRAGSRCARSRAG